MSRGLGWFIAIVSATVVAFVGVVIWYGTDFLFFASDPDRRGEPLTLIYLERGAPDGTEPVLADDHIEVLVDLVESSGGNVLWQGRTSHVELGSILEEWSVALIFSLRRGADAVDLFTSPVYRGLDDDLGERVVGVWAMDELSDLERPSYTFHLVSGEDEPALDHLVKFSRDAAGFGAETVATTAIQAVIRDRTHAWTAVGVHHFENARRREDFFRDPRTTTEHVINARHIEKEAIVVVERTDG